MSQKPGAMHYYFTSNGYSNGTGLGHNLAQSNGLPGSH